jgi:hypothetical protein
MKDKILMDIPNNFTGIVEVCDGTKFMFNIQICHLEHQMYHHESIPAIEYLSGAKIWYFKGIEFRNEEKWKIEVEKLRKNRLISK